METMKFLGKLLKAVDESTNEHKNAQTQSEYLYAQGKMDAYKQVVEWIKEFSMKKGEEQTEWDDTEIAPPVDCDVCG